VDLNAKQCEYVWISKQHSVRVWISKQCNVRV